jgi:hypothetical protein
MEKIWLSEFVIIEDVEHVRFRQGKYTLTVPSKKLHEDDLETLRVGRAPCGGCINLPLHGYYKSNKYSWCAFSRGIANLYDDGWKWVSDDPPLRYLVVKTKALLLEPTKIEQTFYLIKASKKKLKRRINSIKRAILEDAAEQPGGPYKAGYVPSELRYKDQTFKKVILIKGLAFPITVPNVGEMVVITNGPKYVAYGLTVSEPNDGLWQAEDNECRFSTAVFA